MTPRIISQHMEAHERHIDEVNRMMHIQGLYVRDAIASSIGNSFKPKGAKPFEYPKEPYEVHEHVLTEWEKQAQADELFADLMARKERFDARKS